MSRELDQFEIETITAYSGSYTDVIMSGTMGSGNGRIVIALQSSGSAFLSTLVRTGEGTLYSTFAAYGKNFNIGYNRFAQFNCGNETFIDSLVPSPIGYYQINGGQFIHSNIEQIAPWSQALNAKIQLGYPDVFLTCSAPLTTITDTVWLSTYPFQGRYSSLPRLQTFDAPSVLTTFDEDHVDGDIVYDNNTSQTEYTPSSNFNIEFLSLSSSTGTIPLFPNTALSASYGYLMQTTLEVSGTIRASDFSFIPVSYLSDKIELLYKAFFGIGDGFRGQPYFDRTLATVSGAYSHAQYSYWKSQGLIIRGFKYGLYSAVPLTSRMIWRKGKYGQFRDILEQRQQTKFFNMTGLGADGRNFGRRGPTEAVVTNRFLSGSLAAFTASYPLTQNLTDSGIYDFECRSGQPFFDP